MDTNLAEKIADEQLQTTKSRIFTLVPGRIKEGLVYYKDNLTGYSDFESRKLDRLYKPDDLNLHNLSLRPNEYKSIPFLYAFINTKIVLGFSFDQYRRNIDKLIRIYEGDSEASENLMRAKELTNNSSELGALVNSEALRPLSRNGNSRLFFPSQELIRKYLE